VSILKFTAGASVATLLVRERQSRRSAERLAAALLETLLNAIDATDAQTGAHVRRVAHYALILAEAADLPTQSRRNVERVALFHDIGKISEALFDMIHEEGELSPRERDAIATHPARGAEVLVPLEAFYPELGDGVLSHHERWDGTGYPRGLRGEEIPLSARIVAIADTFDAVTYTRRYSSGKSTGDGADVIERGRGSQFDPNLADLFLFPPVFRRIEAMRARLCNPRPQRAGRRAGRAENVDTPDVKFRWRSATQPRPLPDPEHQRSR